MSLLLKPTVPGSDVTVQREAGVVLVTYYAILYSVFHLQQVVSNIGEEVGTIWKRWPGFSEAQNMDHEYFGLEGEFRDEVM